MRFHCLLVFRAIVMPISKDMFARSCISTVVVCVCVVVCGGCVLCVVVCGCVFALGHDLEYIHILACIYL